MRPLPKKVVLFPFSCFEEILHIVLFFKVAYHLIQTVELSLYCINSTDY